VHRVRRILCRFCLTFLNFSGYSWVIRILSPPLWGVARNRNPSQASAKQGFLFFRLCGCGSRPHPCVHSLQRIAAIFHPPALPHQTACLCSSFIGHRSSFIKIMSQGYFRCVAHPIRLIPCDELRPLSDSRSGRFHAIVPNHSLRRTVMTLAIGNIGKQADAAIIRPSNRQQFVFLDRLQRGADSF